MIIYNVDMMNDCRLLCNTYYLSAGSKTKNMQEGTMEFDINKIVFEKATLSDVDKLSHIPN